MEVPLLRADRLRLRAPTLDDFASSRATWSDPVVTRYLGGRPHTGEEVWGRLLRYVGHWQALGFGYWTVETADGRDHVGEVGFSDYRRDITPSFDGIAEMGWVLASHAHGRGYALEACRAALRWWDAVRPGAPVFCIIDPDHAASIRLAEKLGFRREADAHYHGGARAIFSRPAPAAGPEAGPLAVDRGADGATGAAATSFSPITLSGRYVRLVPLQADHDAVLRAAAADGELWRLWYASVPEPDGMAAEIARRLALQAAGSMLPFTVLEEPSGTPVGMTTLMNIDRVLPRVEIGATWYARRVQRTALNTEAKLLLLGHAFEPLRCVAVEFRTHALNQTSRRAIERLGVQADGVLRAARAARDGTIGNSAVYSVIASEWPGVRSHLRWQLDRPR